MSISEHMAPKLSLNLRITNKKTYTLVVVGLRETGRWLLQANCFKRSLIGFVFSNDPKSEKKAKSTTENSSPVVRVAGLWMLLLKSYKPKLLF